MVKENIKGRMRVLNLLHCTFHLPMQMPLGCTLQVADLHLFAHLKQPWKPKWNRISSTLLAYSPTANFRLGKQGVAGRRWGKCTKPSQSVYCRVLISVKIAFLGWADKSRNCLVTRLVASPAFRLADKVKNSSSKNPLSMCLTLLIHYEPCSGADSKSVQCPDLARNLWAPVCVNTSQLIKSLYVRNPGKRIENR